MKIRKIKRILTFILSFCLAINPAVMNAFYRDGGTIGEIYEIRNEDDEDRKKKLWLFNHGLY